MKKIYVIGGGAAGLMAAYFAACGGACVTLAERNAFCGKKLNITGKGRCNLTNNSPVHEFMENVTGNPKFLYKALYAFTPEDTMALFEAFGVPLKTERGNRVFPESDRAADITNALVSVCKESGVRFVHRRVSGVVAENGTVLGVRFGDKTEPCDACILATGGLSYPNTGSDGDGHRMAVALGHSVVKPRPSLVTLVAEDKALCARLMGLSLKNVRLDFFAESGKLLYSEQGEMLFTHFGLSGPVVLSASARLGDFKRVRLVIDLKPALDEETLDKRLLRDFGENKNRDFANSLGALLPQKLIPVVVDKSGIAPDKKVNSVTKEERRRLVSLLKGLEFDIVGTRPIAEAIVTRGGVDVKEINPSTMESRLVSGLYFAGELMDVDAYTGGYNLQIAFSTGRLAGISASE